MKVVYITDVYANVPTFDSRHSHEELIENYHYEYDIEVKPQDIAEFLVDIRMDKHHQNISKNAMKQAIEYLLDNTSLDLDELENDEMFVEFIKDKYEDAAMQRLSEQNERY